MKPTLLYSDAPARGWMPWGALAPFLLIAFVVLPVLITMDPFERWGLTEANGDPVGLNGWYVFLLIPFAMTGALAFAWVLLVERRPLATIGLMGDGAAKAFLSGEINGFVTISGVVAAIWALGGFEAAGFGLALNAPSDLVGIGALFFCFAVQASVEEIVFRGWLLSALARKFNLTLAVVLTCSVFTLLHYGPQQPVLSIIGVFLFSLFACLWAVKAGNIWGVMGWHAGWNWLLAIGFELPVTGMDAGVRALVVKLIPRGADTLTGGADGPEASVVCLVFFACASALLLWRINMRNTQGAFKTI